MKFTENQLKLYAAPLSETENQKCLNAIGMVRDALKNLGFTDDGKDIRKMYDDTYAYSLEMRSNVGARKVRLFIQGSYANNTNVRTQSDVDIAVVQEEVFTTEYRSASSAYPQSDTILAQQYLPQNHLRMKYKNVWKRNLAQMLKEKINQLRYMEILIVKMLIPFRVVDIEIIEMIIGKM